MATYTTYRLRMTAEVVRQDHIDPALPPDCETLGGMCASDQIVSQEYMRDAVARKALFEMLADELARKSLPALKPYIDLDLDRTK